MYNDSLRQQLQKIADTIRALSIDAIQKAESGHPGLPMGCAELAAYLYGLLLRYNPKNPRWINRDRFILSAGHGSMLLYSSLHLAGFDLSMEDIKRFRQWGSSTPGHPEFSLKSGVEATTGPLGQGVGNAVGQALALKMLAARFNREGRVLFSNTVYCLAGDGCMMEGVSSEAASLAGHLRLDNLVLIYDANAVSLDGPLSESFSEDVEMRYRSYGWEVYQIDGHDFDQIDQVFREIGLKKRVAPSLLIMRTIIGKGAAAGSGTHKIHGAPLGADGVVATKKLLGLPQDDFFVLPSIYDFFANRARKGALLEAEWTHTFNEWRKEDLEGAKEWDRMVSKEIPSDLEEKLAQVQISSSSSGRRISQQLLESLAEELPALCGGSADLSSSDMTMMKQFPIISSDNFKGRNIKYGVREFAMATIANGLAQSGMFIPFIGTFLTFSDYMRGAIRLAALSHLQVIYQFTHDSIFVGEDGPTHQPVEQLAALRAIPHLQVIRPADHHEVKMAWLAALRYQGPTALILSRQAVRELEKTDLSYEEGMGRGGYIVRKERNSIPDYTFFATGSELALALDVATVLEESGKEVRVVSMPCWEIFERQSKEYCQEVIGKVGSKRVSIEAAASFGWHKWIGSDGLAIAVDSFGASAPAGRLAAEFGFTIDTILVRLLG